MVQLFYPSSKPEPLFIDHRSTRGYSNDHYEKHCYTQISCPSGIKALISANPMVRSKIFFSSFLEKVLNQSFQKM